MGIRFGSVLEHKAGGTKECLMRQDSSDDINDPYIQDEGDSDDDATAPAESGDVAEASASSEVAASNRVLGAPEVVEHYSVDDIGPRSLLEMLEELSVKDDELPALTPYVEGDDEMAIALASLGEATASTREDLVETTVASTREDLGETTVASSMDLGETTVASFSGDLGETTTVASRTGDLGETATVASRTGDLGETTVASSSRDLGETTVASTTGDLGETTTVAPPRSAAVGEDTEAAARAKARQLQLKALLAASARKLSELSLFSICAFCIMGRVCTLNIQWFSF